MEDLSNNNYDSSSITILRGLDAVRKRPGMYIGDTDDGSGLHHMIYEVVDNAIDESLAGYCDTIYITINKDNSITVEDNGRGIPVDIHHEEGISAAEVIMTQLHAGGKFDQNSYKVSGGLHGVGVSVVNALSKILVLTIYKNQKEYYIEFEHGIAKAPLAEINTQTPDENGNYKTGTKITFHPSEDTFTQIVFDYKIIERRIRELAFLNSNVTIYLVDNRFEQTQSTKMHYSGGLKEFIKYMDRNKNPIHDDVIAFSATKDQITVDVALRWNDSYHENTLCFTNNIPQKDGGTHLSGFRSSLTRTVNSFFSKVNISKKATKIDLVGDDSRDGLTCIVSIKVPDPKFSSQTKDKLVSSEVRPIVESTVYEHLSQWFEEHPNETSKIINKVIEAALAREAAKKARELTRKKNTIDPTSLPGKLANCSEKDPKLCELFIVEGDSAGGSAKQGRNRHNQAVLPLRGKILNVEKSTLDKILSSAEIGTLVMALGTGIGKADFDIEKCRYHKIIIMTDADVDGSHIRTLLLTFIYRQMPELIHKGYIYIAQPPLYKTKRGNSEVYHKTQKQLDEFLINISINDNAYIKYEDGSSVMGNDLLNVAQLSQDMMKYINQTNNYELAIFEQLAIAGLCNESLLHNDELITNKLTQVIQRINHILEVETQINVKDNICNVKINKNGVSSIYELTVQQLTNLNMQHLNHLYNKLKAYFYQPFTLVLNNQEYLIQGPSSLLDRMFEYAKKGMYLQRYKGLGEMNPEQLWETTLDINSRTLVQVNAKDAEQADEIFSILMGDNVEPRRNFIQTNAINVSNLDV